MGFRLFCSGLFRENSVLLFVDAITGIGFRTGGLTQGCDSSILILDILIYYIYIYIFIPWKSKTVVLTVFTERLFLVRKDSRGVYIPMLHASTQGLNIIYEMFFIPW